MRGLDPIDVKILDHNSRDGACSELCGNPAAFHPNGSPIEIAARRLVKEGRLIYKPCSQSRPPHIVTTPAGREALRIHRLLSISSNLVGG